MALYRNGQFVSDPWRFAVEGEITPALGDVALPKARFFAERTTLLARATRLGLVLDPGETLDGVEEIIKRLSLIVLRFPRFADGRPYSLARKLRDQIGYRGESLSMGYHPIAWRKAIGTGRMFYTAIGHRPENYDEPHAAALLAEGIAWAMRTKGTKPHD